MEVLISRKVIISGFHRQKPHNTSSCFRRSCLPKSKCTCGLDAQGEVREQLLQRNWQRIGTKQQPCAGPGVHFLGSLVTTEL